MRTCRWVDSCSPAPQPVRPARSATLYAAVGLRAIHELESDWTVTNQVEDTASNMLRAGIIGTARVGSWYDDLLAETPEQIPSSHAGCYAAHPRTVLVAGSDLDPERLAAFGERWGIAP